MVRGSVYDAEELRGMSIENMKSSIRKLLPHWWAENQYTSQEELTQNAESLVGLRGSSLRKDKRFDREYS